MKRAMAFLLIIAILFTGCMPMQSQTKTVNGSKSENSLAGSAEPMTEPVILKDVEVRYDSLDYDALSAYDGTLSEYIEYSVYSGTINSLNSSDYFVEDVSAAFISKEYLESTAFNSQSNIYFGYTLAELNERFEGKKYIFTLGDDGTTIVQELHEIENVQVETMMKNVAVGAGVILVCVTVSLVSAANAPAISLIFATSAVAAGTSSGISATLGGISAGIVRGIQTGDFKEAMDAAAMGATEGFKWGAISGAVAGGINQAATLYNAAKQTQFGMNTYAQIQQETGYPLDVIKQFHTMDEYQAFKEANLKSAFVNNKSALIKTDIDLTRVDSKGRTNLERMRLGLAPQDSNGFSYELHHVGQKKDGTLAMLSQAEHDNPAIHGFLEQTEAHAVGSNWDAERQSFWKAFAEMIA